ncbi:MAG: thiamine pyrophosphate-dependent dehydrogenase E1 component subunit alpha [Streptosporangiaceae bacterium]
MNHEQLVRIYVRMVTMRRLEEAVASGVSSGQIHGEMHLGIGQESVAAVLAEHLRPQDAAVSTHRAHLHALACGVDPVELLAEVFERDGLNGGKGGHMHLFAPERHFMCTGIVGAAAPIATGYALAQQVRQDGGITVAVAGDGAMNQGGVFEAMNLAAVRSLPMLFLVEDNGYSISVPKADSTAGDLAGRAAAFGIESGRCDGRDIQETDAVIGAMVAKVRTRGAPAMVVASVYRFRGHYEGDLDLYRPAQEREHAMSDAADPLLITRALVARGLTDAKLHSLENEAVEQVARWLATALERPDPDRRTAREGVFADA